jgi:glycyl-tRNA synthetase beta chain
MEKSVSLLREKIERSAEEISQDVLGFFRGRLSSLFISRGFSHDVVESILSLGIDDMADIASRIDALQQMKKEPDFEPLATAFKRVVNIITGKSSEHIDPDLSPDKALFEQQEENNLFDKYIEIKDQVKDLMEQKSYLEALKMIASIRETVDSFFDNVLVMAENKKVMQNRLALLCGVNSLFTDFADFSKISSE